MAKKTRGQARRKRHKSIRKHISGTTDRPRLNVFRSLNDIYAQVIDDSKGKTLASASTIDAEMRKQMKGKAKTEQAALVGEEIAKRAKANGIKKVVFDRGGFHYSGRVKALADGARKEGLDF
jgi:large subunit ribosomal protein L18